jgi:hypothetical protein
MGELRSHIWGITLLTICLAAAPLARADERALRNPDASLRAAPIPQGASPYLPDGRTLSGSTGAPIPCECIFKGRTFKVGERVCMATNVGTVITRCELAQNNTTWQPSSEPCTVSHAVTEAVREASAE